MRNLAVSLLRIPVVADYLIGRDLRDDLALPDYAWAERPASNRSL